MSQWTSFFVSNPKSLPMFKGQSKEKDGGELELQPLCWERAHGNLNNRFGHFTWLPVHAKAQGETRQHLEHEEQEMCTSKLEVPPWRGIVLRSLRNSKLPLKSWK